MVAISRSYSAAIVVIPNGRCTELCVVSKTDVVRVELPNQAASLSISTTQPPSFTLSLHCCITCLIRCATYHHDSVSRSDKDGVVSSPFHDATIPQQRVIMGSYQLRFRKFCISKLTGLVEDNAARRGSERCELSVLMNHAVSCDVRTCLESNACSWLDILFNGHIQCAVGQPRQCQDLRLIMQLRRIPRERIDYDNRSKSY